MPRRLLALAEIIPAYAKIGWWGLFSPRFERAPLEIVQAAIVDQGQIFLCIRGGDLRGWELPGGGLHPNEAAQDGLIREVREETGLAVEVGPLIGTYTRTGIRPHTARVYACKITGGSFEPSAESHAAQWFPPNQLPETLLPWCRAPIEDAFSTTEKPVQRTESQTTSHVLKTFLIDLKMRLTPPTAGPVDATRSTPSRPPSEGPLVGGRGGCSEVKRSEQ